MIPIIPQNTDRNVSMRDFNDANGGIRVTSIFPTIQGEGPYAGWPAMFVRLAGCNYGSKTDFCKFCDTSFQIDNGTLYSPNDLLDRLIRDPKYHHEQVLVVTGGEPTLQLNLLDLIVKADNSFHKIQIETNGTQPKFFQEAGERGMRKMFHTVVSPKANLRIGSYPKVHDDVRWWADCFKFVLSSDPENPHHEIPDWALADAKHSAKSVYVSPMAVYKRPYDGEVSSIWDDTLIDRARTAANYAYAAQYAMKHNLKLSLQTHLFTAIP